MSDDAADSDEDAAAVPLTLTALQERFDKALAKGLIALRGKVPVVIGMSGVFYGVAAVLLGAGLLYKAIAMWRADDIAGARPLFFFTIMYLFLIFVALLADRAVQTFV